ncbi:DUF2150 family protein [Halosimplex pelagicum]|uniref:DUF2150 family protein n=1 Tax=Halosimplex pelagicum TaxID=869886 RepID=A0A7D5PDW4_9EURY|nr:DUF2150 family protein [Halosimplex pelagicum]QLH84502.1 DUF2150 family protein [Halosimplex pelagicum]
MSNQPGEYYTPERWQNWLDRIDEEDLDPEDDDTAQLLWNMQDDTAIAVVKVVSDFEEGVLDEDEALSEIEDMREVVLAEPEFDDEEALMLVDSVQTSLVCVFYAAEEFVVGGPAEDAPIGEYVGAAADAEAEEDLDTALSYCVQAGTLVIDGAEFDPSMAEEVEPGLVVQWVNGLDSLQTAMKDPEVVEEDDE